MTHSPQKLYEYSKTTIQCRGQSNSSFSTIRQTNTICNVIINQLTNPIGVINPQKTCYCSGHLDSQVAPALSRGKCLSPFSSLMAINASQLSIASLKKGWTTKTKVKLCGIFAEGSQISRCMPTTESNDIKQYN